jgi:predicted transcriptional regulator
MSARTRLTIEISDTTRAGLDRLAAGSDEDTARIAADAVTSYVEHELDVVRGIEAGLSDLHQGRVARHEEAMGEISDLIDAARARKA